ncbi:hypothetical protein CHLRE_11g467725v5 [Chlamydomonas reinhardtii]|uniref:Uncharacterized protein n=1 Tax=Chlamydomonas reinhardtii TaxID=3055 RepID=A8JEF5_CHLRE|nr:uncharacterized protein CHLRE_11g467725v5 [Chlamydomonas reinhardtii]PNW76602.1 hypothetical protein CHLRE_11g467725v5 [Chlamydomonas reinhardtii]|eukprot:XP_001701169.1 predicted protein [Chlamydomonas reinhardtii]
MTPFAKLLLLAGLVAAAAAASINVTQCGWDGADCVLTSGFIASLPERLGTPTTNSAKVLARAAYRATVCANYTASRIDCVAAATEYGCEWDAVAQSCGIKDLLDPELLRRSAFCPGSRLDAAVSCASLTGGAADGSSGSGWQDTCASASYGGYSCKLVNGSSVLTSQPVQTLGDAVMGLINGVAAQAVQAIKDAAGQLNVTVSNATISLLVNNATAAANNSQACVAAWTTDTSYLKSLADTVISGLGSGKDVLSSLMTPELFGSCNTSSKLMSTVNTCPIKLNKADCAAVSGCSWVDLAQACTVAMDVVERMMLDPKDIWVAAYNNASALCDSLATQSSCNVTTPRLSLNLTVDPAILKNLSSLLPSFAIDALNNITNGAGISVGGSTTILGGAGGGAAGMAATAWWTVALAAVAALVLGHGVDQHPRWP